MLTNVCASSSLSLAPQQPREHDARGGVADRDRRPADDQAERDVRQHDADHEHEQRRRPARCAAGESSRRPTPRCAKAKKHSHSLGKRPVALSGERQPSRSRQRERIECEQEARGRPQASRRDAQLEPDRRPHARAPRTRPAQAASRPPSRTRGASRPIAGRRRRNRRSRASPSAARAARRPPRRWPRTAARASSPSGARPRAPAKGVRR